jgi:hypothetical protein
MKVTFIESKMKTQPNIHMCTPLSLMVKINESPKSNVYKFVNVESAYTSHVMFTPT